MRPGLADFGEVRQAKAHLAHCHACSELRRPPLGPSPRSRRTAGCTATSRGRGRTPDSPIARRRPSIVRATRRPDLFGRRDPSELGDAAACARNERSRARRRCRWRRPACPIRGRRVLPGRQRSSVWAAALRPRPALRRASRLSAWSRVLTAQPNAIAPEHRNGRASGPKARPLTVETLPSQVGSEAPPPAPPASQADRSKPAPRTGRRSAPRRADHPDCRIDSGGRAGVRRPGGGGRRPKRAAPTPAAAAETRRRRRWISGPAGVRALIRRCLAFASGAVARDDGDPRRCRRGRRRAVPRAQVPLASRSAFEVEAAAAGPYYTVDSCADSAQRLEVNVNGFGTSGPSGLCQLHSPRTRR